jgi:hypothetical protein
MGITHILTVIEPVNMNKELGKNIKSESLLTCGLVNQKTIDYIESLIMSDFDKQGDFNKLIEISDALKDLGLDEQCGTVLTYLRENRSDEYRNYLAGYKTDTSGADGTDDR